ncbi:ABC transporter ATP-binding protein [Alkalihalobacillus alcalophilus ATCC 27647 = CGMCC 1.3604]|uniref:ABC transporter ATP-binding protein n=1 Tax=Alkalihalobacillus alcalophilus ATCC 27647 = CGMCC 1.3604 TaxID=1218173 RepID=J8TQ17_ALKAL|nr:thiol reductant ABC exporter subunit CydC [Alkalihalobacillus alcalophilus]AFV25833.1 cysteine transporter [Alkalihalobacillus alcalophilus ATCC 27647 = CGMCC 1.3604]KGA96977.1 ABC transporter ATP-binding protein [Alkalihalobacillus alcalophilus ATCC 27647 = CGMCC 1.3604]MED1564220.1 thiol reductant ABC exporter subunit CydC [Alkalihalobacillus alcalophilus]THG90291.1 ABC transporter ATP-binding protein [Alkalihalobacillus alcalophilus ATCC 27647 = CGMCC 1.3604]
MRHLSMVISIMLQEKRDILLSIVFGFIAGITAVGLFSASGYLISQAALVPPIYTLMIIVAIVKLLGITSAVSRYGERYFSHRATFTMLSNIRVFVYQKIEPLSSTILQRYRSGDLLARIVGDVESLQNFLLRVFYPPVVTATVFIATIAFTTIFSIGTAFILLSGMLLLTLIIPALFLIKQSRVDQKNRQIRGNLSSEFTEFLYGYKDLKINQQATSQRNQLIITVQAYEKEQKRAHEVQLFNESVIGFLSLFISVLVLAFAGYQVVQGNLEGILLAMLFMISITVFEQTAPMALVPHFLQQSNVATKRLVQVWNQEQESEQESYVKWENHHIPSIQFEDVSFTYMDETRPTLDRISFELPAGSKTAIVGASGSGKTTILQVLLKVQPLDSGKVTFNDWDIDKIKEEEIWKASNVSLQSNHFFFGTIRDNLEIANPEASDTELTQALRDVQLAHLNLEDAVQEKGANLSGGEKQRLALARLFLKEAQIWVLDEPTSSMDALTEERMLSNLFEKAGTATLVLVSHRLTGLEKMDQIIVMDHGKIVESGSYKQLMDKNGYFKQMKDLEKEIFIT